ncbi:MAG: NAD(P)-binding domain-containing protein [Mobilicoccus sp.]|nr:NAD(P)-binding domain-containing protein [Mobilicoccus sp.]
MNIAFLGTGRMGTELALHLLRDHDLVVWNRTAARTQRLADAGARLAASPSEAVEGADIVVTALFGPDAVREIVTGPGLIPGGVPWVDTTTVSPSDADEFAAAVESYVAVPVVGTLGPARAGMLGVYVGCADEQRRAQVADLVAPWADPERLRPVATARAAATGKLLANLALAVSAQGLREALTLGRALGADEADVLWMLERTGLSFLAGMKGPFVLGERDSADGDFTVDAIAKDARLMIESVDAGGDALPALAAALTSLAAEQSAGRGDHDFSAMLLRDASPDHT